MVAREERIEQIVDKAVSVFAEKGYYKATTAMVAKEAGLTQPYIFHFFKNKEELFKAVIDRAGSRIYDTFMNIEAPKDELEETMGKGFIEIMHTHRDEILMVMQAHAVAEPDIRIHIREKFKIMHGHIVVKFQDAGIPDAEKAASQFFGMGFLITVAEVLDLPDLLCFD